MTHLVQSSCASVTQAVSDMRHVDYVDYTVGVVACLGSVSPNYDSSHSVMI
jgi:hypothetical protein